MEHTLCNCEDCCDSRGGHGVCSTCESIEGHGCPHTTSCQDMACPLYKISASATPEDLLEGQHRPSVQQTAWVIGHLVDHLCEEGTFRRLIYNRMGYGPEAYCPLYLAGGMTLSNTFFEYQEMLKGFHLTVDGDGDGI